MKKLLKRIRADFAFLIITLFCGILTGIIMTQVVNENNYTSTKIVIIGLCLFKILYFIMYSLELITRLANVKTFTISKYLTYILYIVILIQLSFALDYTLLYNYDIKSFKGIATDLNIIKQFLNMQYFSTVTFATVGYGDITPNSLAARGLVTLEILTSLLIIVVIITNFILIKDDLKENSPFGKLDELD